MKGITRKRLGDMLVDSGAISPEQLDSALAIQKESGGLIGEVLIQNGFLRREELFSLLEEQLGIPYINLADTPIDADVVSCIPENMAKRYTLMPVRKNGGALTVVMADPLNAKALSDVSVYTQCEVEPAIGDAQQIRQSISRHYSSRRAKELVSEFMRTERPAQAKPGASDKLMSSAADTPAVKLLNLIFEQALRRGASDIHIEPHRDIMRIRLRIDGQLTNILDSDIELLPAIVSRVKILASLNIAEKRLPQDGRAVHSVDGEDMELRVSVVPTVLGEKVVIRVITAATYSIGLGSLGLTPGNLELFKGMIKRPYGIVLVTGPTGSGKTTTIYAALREINRPGINIITVEDPVERILPGISQVQINPAAGLSFGNALRSLFRQDPDVMLIGEIRDFETAEIAARAAITGHLVLSTLHTNDTASTITRLVDIGVPRYMAAASIVGIAAQRLVRRLCPACRKAVELDAAGKDFLGVDGSKGYTVYTPQGCEECHFTGYKGRIAVYEIMEITPEIRTAIYSGSSSDEILHKAVKAGMRTMRSDCAAKVLAGVTSVEEMLSVIPA